MNTLNTRLKKISDVILDEDLNYIKLFSVIAEYKKLLFEASGIILENDEDDQNIYTDSGKALSPKFAILCVDDIMRTKRFCLGLYKAIKKVVSEKDGPVRIVYAGTGPFATLILPSLTRFTAEEIQLTLLEINPTSYNSLNNLIDYFDFSKYVETIECCDAVNYKISKPEGIDIVVTETLQKALKKEPQVAISYNLISQVPDHTILIPEEISLELLLVDRDKSRANKTTMGNSIKYYKHVGSLYKINKEEISIYQKDFKNNQPNFEFPEVKVTLPANANRDFHNISIETKIKIYEDQELLIGESGLTFLTRITDLNSTLQTFNSVVSKYQCSKNPGIQLRLEM